MDNSIFKEYFSEQEFIDRYVTDDTNAIDVLVPLYHTNDLWKANLHSIYREIPVKRLLISDGGCIDDSIEIVQDFPRVEIHNHRDYKSLGKCTVELMRVVDTEWFALLESDVYLPPGWFDKMIEHKGEYDWYGCPMNLTTLVNYRLNAPNRPYAGSQLGRKEAFVNGLDKIDDDYVYRQIDFVFNKMVEDAGFKTGKVDDMFHFHQIMYRKSKGFQLEVTDMSLKTNTSDEEKHRTNDMQIRGTVKYLSPSEKNIIRMFEINYKAMVLSGELNYQEFKKWVNDVNPEWNAYVKNPSVYNNRLGRAWAKVGGILFGEI